MTVISTGSIETLGADSVAVIAQSIGGGGGNSTFSIPEQLGSLGGSTLQIGGGGAGTQGANGTVIVQVSGGAINTSGDLSYGLLSQAIGAGGGNGACPFLILSRLGFWAARKRLARPAPFPATAIRSMRKIRILS